MSPEIKMKDIPQSFMDAVRNGLKNYLVPMLGFSEADPVPLGSGTYVRIGDRYGILTAAHVWNAASSYQKIFIILTDRSPTAFSISPRHISPKLIWGGKENEWGPDLAFLELAPNDVATLKGSKSFLNLAKQKAGLLEKPPNTEKGLWAVTGLVAEFSTIEHKLEEKINTAKANCQAFFSTIHDTHIRGEFDFFEAGANLGLEGVPKSFGGVSGGGLWQIDISQKKATGEIYWDEKLYLRGVAYWEEEQPTAGLKAIRLHGPKSLYETAWKEWEFPEDV